MRSPSSKYLMSLCALGSSAFTPLREHVPLSRESKSYGRICVEDLEVCRCHKLGLKRCGGGGWDSWMMTEGKWLGEWLVVKRFNSWRVAPIETPPLFDSQVSVLHLMTCHLPSLYPYSTFESLGGMGDVKLPQPQFAFITAASYALCTFNPTSGRRSDITHYNI